MALFAVSYDLHNNRQYEPLWSALKSAGGVRLLESFWLLKSTYSAAILRNLLKAQIDADDAVAVIEVTPTADWATTANVYTGGTNLLKTW
jgi:hypothetical protein